MTIGLAEFKYNETLTLVFDLKRYKDEIIKVAIKYLNKELTPENDETGAKGFYDLAAKIIDENCSFIWNLLISNNIQDFLYKKLTEYTPTVLRELF